MDETLRAKIEEASRRYFELTSGPIYTLYADMEYLQDFRFGAMIALLHKRGMKEAEVCLNYIREKLPDYNNRLDYDTVKYFPMLKLQESDLDEIIKTNPLGVAYISPFTSVWNILLDTIRAVGFHNDKVSEKTIQFEVILNLTTSPWHQDLKARIRHTVYVAGDPNACVHFRETPRYTEGYDFYRAANFLFLHDVESFINVDPVLRTKICDEMKFENNQIIARPHVNPDCHIAPENEKMSLDLTSEMLNKIMDFEWLPAVIVT